MQGGKGGIAISLNKYVYSMSIYYISCFDCVTNNIYCPGTYLAVLLFQFFTDTKTV